MNKAEWQSGDPERRSGNDDQLGFIKTWLISLSSGLLIQFAGAIWWASSMATNMEYVKSDMLNLKTQMSANIDDRYRAQDARRDFATVYLKVDAIEVQQKINTEKIILLTDRIKH